jgi:hypothetical protein
MRICATDLLARTLHEREREDWRELRFEPFESGNVRKALERLAREVVKARRRPMTARQSVVPDDATAAPRQDSRVSTSLRGSHHRHRSGSAPSPLSRSCNGRPPHVSKGKPRNSRSRAPTSGRIAPIIRTRRGVPRQGRAVVPGVGGATGGRVHDGLDRGRAPMGSGTGRRAAVGGVGEAAAPGSDRLAFGSRPLSRDVRRSTAILPAARGARSPAIGAAAAVGGR